MDIGIIVPGNKGKRLDAEAKCKWSVDDIRIDYQDKLKEQMRLSFTPDLFTLMFHNDFKKQVEGLGHICSIIDSQLHIVIEILDIIFK